MPTGNDLLLKPVENYILKVIRRCNFYETGAEALGKVVAEMKTHVGRRITGKWLR